MYGIKLGSVECAVFYESNNARTYAFKLWEIRAIISSLLDKKSRNNGVGKYLLDTLRTKGMCRYDFTSNSGPLAFYCKAVCTGEYSITLLGKYPHELIGRLNRSSKELEALESTKTTTHQRRKVHVDGLSAKSKKQKTLRALPDTHRLKHHFRNSSVTCADAVVVIAYAAKRSVERVRKRLVRSLDARSVASLRLHGGFVIRVDLQSKWRGFLDLSSLVKIRTTNDNKHGVYRRLRIALHKQLNCERKVRTRAQEKYLTAKKAERLARRFAA